MVGAGWEDMLIMISQKRRLLVVAGGSGWEVDETGKWSQMVQTPSHKSHGVAMHSMATIVSKTELDI